MELLVIVILLTVTGAQDSQLEGPQNTLGVVGSNVTLKCVTPYRNCSQLDWTKYGPGSPMSVFKDGRGGISVPYRERYSIENSSGCNLVIKNVEMTDAGRFVCSAVISSSTTETAASLIILQALPNCQINASVDNTVEGDGVQLTCEVTYNGTNRASMVWKGVKDAQAAVENGKTISRSYSVVASAPEVPSFTCATSFAIETKDNGYYISGLAINIIPTATCATSAIRVLYSIKDVHLSPSFSNYRPGTVITCNAKGHPLPTFKWQETENNGVWMDIRNQNGSKFTVSDVSSKRYRCVAMNVVKGKMYNATSHEFQVNNTDDNGSVTDVTTTVTTLLLLTLIVPIAVFVGVGFLLLIILLVICFCVRCCPGYKCCHSGKKSKAKMSRGEQPLRENPDIYVNVNQVGEQESAYASLGAQRDANEYMSLELRQNAKL